MPKKQSQQPSTSTTSSATSPPPPAATKNFSVGIVGGGLVGSLAAVYAAQKGWDVHVYELRKDPRKEDTARGRSINLALSVRGLSALKNAGIEQEIFDSLIPMKGRMIHGLDGKLGSIPYSSRGEAINSVDRKRLNEHLLSAAEQFPNVKLYFDYNLRECNLDEKKLTFQHRKDGYEVTVQHDFIIGADGAYSKVRREIMRKTRMNYSQEYIDHGYVELCIPANSAGDYAMDPNHLHIWPRHTFMLIALPNPDASFTVTLFMPWEKFDAIRTEADLLEFFDANFPDAIGLMGKDFLVAEYFKNPKGSLISIKCKPYHYKSSCVILGDAAHAMVPFYGQGMNCGFEDVETFFTLLNSHFQEDAEAIARPPTSSVAVLLNRYSELRHPDASSICDLAMYNYIEMRSSVVSKSYLLRKKIDGVLNYFFPKQWIPLYSMVSFSNIRYSEVIAREERQKAIVGGAVNTLKWGLYGAMGFVAGAMWLRYAGIKNVCWVVEQSGSKIGKLVFSS